MIGKYKGRERIAVGRKENLLIGLILIERIQ